MTLCGAISLDLNGVAVHHPRHEERRMSPGSALRSLPGLEPRLPFRQAPGAPFGAGLGTVLCPSLSPHLGLAFATPVDGALLGLGPVAPRCRGGLVRTAAHQQGQRYRNKTLTQTAACHSHVGSVSTSWGCRRCLRRSTGLPSCRWASRAWPGPRRCSTRSCRGPSSGRSECPLRCRCGRSRICQPEA